MKSWNTRTACVRVRLLEHPGISSTARAIPGHLGECVCVWPKFGKPEQDPRGLCVCVCPPSVLVFVRQHGYGALVTSPVTPPFRVLTFTADTRPSLSKDGSTAAAPHLLNVDYRGSTQTTAQRLRCVCESTLASLVWCSACLEHTNTSRRSGSRGWVRAHVFPKGESFFSYFRANIS